MLFTDLLMFWDPIRFLISMAIRLLWQHLYTSDEQKSFQWRQQQLPKH